MLDHLDVKGRVTFSGNEFRVEKISLLTDLDREPNLKELPVVKALLFERAHLKRLKQTKKCPKCNLQGADLQYTNLGGSRSSTSQP